MSQFYEANFWFSNNGDWIEDDERRERLQVIFDDKVSDLIVILGCDNLCAVYPRVYQQQNYVLHFHRNTRKQWFLHRTVTSYDHFDIVCIFSFRPFSRLQCTREHFVPPTKIFFVT